MPDSSDPIFKSKWDGGVFSPLSVSVILHTVAIVGLSGFIGNWGMKEYMAPSQPEIWVEVVEPEEPYVEEVVPLLSKKKEVESPPEQNKEKPNEIVEKKKQEVVPSRKIFKPQPQQEEAQLRGVGGVESYISRVVSKINRNKFYPSYARARHEEGEVVLSFHILRDGQVRGITVVSSSFSHVLDGAAIEAVRKSMPFDPPPAYLSDRDLEFRLPIRYVLRGSGN